MTLKKGKKNTKAAGDMRKKGDFDPFIAGLKAEIFDDPLFRAIVTSEHPEKFLIVAEPAVRERE